MIVTLIIIDIVYRTVHHAELWNQYHQAHWSCFALSQDVSRAQLSGESIGSVKWTNSSLMA